MRGRSRALALLGAAVAAMTSGFLVAPSPAYAAELKLSPNSGPAGSGFTIFFGGFTRSTKCPITVLWDKGVLTTTDGTPTSVEVSVPSGATVGLHNVVAQQSGGCQDVARALFDVTPPPRPTPVPTPQPTPTRTVPPNPTAPPPATRPPSPGIPPTGDPGSPTPGSDLTPTPSPTPSPSAPLTPSASPDLTSGELVLDRPNVRPGEPLTATGSGCAPNAPVVLTSEEDQVGLATADSTGAFTAPVQFSRLDPGRRVVTATCGAVLTTEVDLIVSSSTSGQAGTVVVLIFFVLVGIALLRWQYNSARR
jgi:hypothetical protein